jgi:hypothetical protein
VDELKNPKENTMKSILETLSKFFAISTTHSHDLKDMAGSIDWNDLTIDDCLVIGVMVRLSEGGTNNFLDQAKEKLEKELNKTLTKEEFYAEEDKRMEKLSLSTPEEVIRSAYIRTHPRV